MVWAQQWLDERMGITCGVVRNDLDVRDREHAPRSSSTWGTVPSDVYAAENGVRFFFDVLKGQKTGFFYDHRDNRKRLAEYAATGTWGEKPRFLDCFSYVGSWGLALAKACPTATVVCADASAEALAWVKRNAEENGLKGRVEAVETDLLADKGIYAADSYQIAVSDPPAMTSSAKQAEEGKRAHEKCFGLAAQATAPEGITAFAACSFHLSWEDFLEACHKGARKRGHNLQLFELGRQAADHPMLSALPETRYLKCAFGRRLDGSLR
jgi:23S rRNA (cytosine1962-C5)-methyltransferase